MFERVITQTIQRISHDVLRERSLISLTDILEDERIPERLKPFFATEVQWWLYNESLARAANRRFDYEQPELASLLNYLERVQFNHARFEREEFLAVLDSAVKLTYNYLCRPQTTLKWYIFRGQPVKPLREVMLRFDAVSDYEYFRNVFIDWVESKQNERATFDAISATEFERVIRRTDDQILLNCTVEDLLAIMTPLFEFVGEGEAQRVPVDALVIFFDDKNIKRLVDHLERYRERGHEFTTREEFVSLLDELLSVADDEPEADFSQVYQNDELDDVVRRHIGSGPEGGSVDASAADAGFTDVVPEPAEVMTAVAQPMEAEQYEVPEGVGSDPTHGSAASDDRAARYDGPAEQPTSVAAHEPAAVGMPVGNLGVEAPDALPDMDVTAAVEHSREAAEESNRSAAEIQTPSVDVRTQAPESISRPAPPALEDELAMPAFAPASASPGPVDPATVPVEPVGPVEEKAEPWPPQPDRVIPTLMTEAETIEHEPEDGVSRESVDLPRPATETVSEAASPVTSAAPVVAASRSTPAVASQVPSQAQAAAPSVAKPVRTVPAPSTPEGVAPQAAASAPVPAPSTAPASQPAASSVPLEMRPDAATDVRRYIDSSLERKVIKKIFGKSKQEYDQAIQKLNAAENWRIASQILDELFIRFDVDPYSRTAVRFTDSVYGRYLSRGE
jgi:hypothetical protein